MTFTKNQAPESLYLFFKQNIQEKMHDMQTVI